MSFAHISYQPPPTNFISSQQHFAWTERAGGDPSSWNISEHAMIHKYFLSRRPVRARLQTPTPMYRVPSSMTNIYVPAPAHQTSTHEFTPCPPPNLSQYHMHMSRQDTSSTKSLDPSQQFPACGFRPENTLVLISHFANSLRIMLSRIPYLPTWANGVTRHGTCSR